MDSEIDKFLKLCGGKQELTEKDLPDGFKSVGCKALTEASDACNEKNFKFLFDHGCVKIDLHMLSGFNNFMILKDIMIGIGIREFASLFYHILNNIDFLSLNLKVFDLIKLWHYYRVPHDHRVTHSENVIKCDIDGIGPYKQGILTFEDYTRDLVTLALSSAAFEIVQHLINEFGIIPSGKLFEARGGGGNTKKENDEQTFRLSTANALKNEKISESEFLDLMLPINFCNNAGMRDVENVKIFIEKYLLTRMLSDIEFDVPCMKDKLEFTFPARMWTSVGNHDIIPDVHRSNKDTHRKVSSIIDSILDVCPDAIEYLFQKGLVIDIVAMKHLSKALARVYDIQTCKDIRSKEDEFFKDHGIIVYIKNGYKPRNITENGMLELIKECDDIIERKKNVKKIMQSYKERTQTKYDKQLGGNDLSDFNSSLKNYIKK